MYFNLPLASFDNPASDTFINFDDYESLQYFQRVLISGGVIDALREAGINEGDTVSIYELEFDFVE